MTSDRSTDCMPQHLYSAFTYNFFFQLCSFRCYLHDSMRQAIFLLHTTFVIFIFWNKNKKTTSSTRSTKHHHCLSLKRCALYWLHFNIQLIRNRVNRKVLKSEQCQVALCHYIFHVSISLSTLMRWHMLLLQISAVCETKKYAPINRINAKKKRSKQRMHFIDMPWIRKSIVPVVRSNADHACVWKISLFSSTPTFHSSASHLLSTFHGNRAMTFSLPFKWEYKDAAHLWDVSLCLFVWFLFCCGSSLFP